MGRMRGLLLAILTGFLCLAATGCRRSDLVEAELRTRERELRETRSGLFQSEAYNQALQSEIHDLRKGSKLTPERASQIYTIREVVLGRQTGGYDDDNLPGDEALQVVLEPRDPDGQAIKAPGHLRVTALEVSSEGLKTPLSTWEIPPQELRRTWRNGLLSTGYYVVLPWKNWPTSSRVRVVAQFILADGRVFEADKDVTIRLPAPFRGPTPPGSATGCPTGSPPRMPPADAPILEPAGPEFPGPAPREVIPGETRRSSIPSVEPVSVWKKAGTTSIREVDLLRPAPNP
jgi:hypothetical protein